MVIINSISTHTDCTMQATHSTLTARRTTSSLPVQASSASAHMQDLSVDSELLLRGNKTVSIVHNGAIYRLQATKLGKLILTK